MRGQTSPPNSQGQSGSQGIFVKGLVARPPYEPITGKQRLHWALKGTVGPQSLITGVFAAAIGTARDAPQEYGPSWTGFGKRYEVRLSGISTGNVMEAGLGAIWGEDPRYERLPNAPFGARVRNAIKLTFFARYTDRHYGLAYARFVAVTGNNVLSDVWRPSSETHAGDTSLRVLAGLLGRMGGNAFAEFWPDIRRHIHLARSDETD